MALSWTGITDNTKILTDSEIKKAISDGYVVSSGTDVPTTELTITKSRTLQYLNNIDTTQNNAHLYNKTTTELVSKQDLINLRDCGNCRAYNVYVDQADINLSKNNGGNGIISLFYYPCGTTGGTISTVTFQTSGFNYNNICIQNCASTEPYLHFDYDGGSIPSNSKIFELAGNCAPSSPVNHDCGTTFTTTISKPGKVSLLDYFTLDNNYGNFTITVSGTQQNDIAEVFVGNLGEKYGEIVTLAKGANNITQNVGYYNSNGSKNVDLAIYSSSSTAFQPYTLSITVSCTSTVDCQSALPVTQTYVNGTTLNVTKAGVIHYSIDSLNSIAVTVLVGTYTITSCYVYETLSPLLIVNNPATYTVTYSGTTCSPSGTSGTSGSSGLGSCVNMTFSANQGFSATAWWLDCNGNQKTQFVSVGQTLTVCGINGSGSGLPLSYGNSC